MTQLVTVCISHGDVDGITSGAIGLLALPGSVFYFSRPSQIHQDLYRVAHDRPETVLISDIAVNAKRFPDIKRALESFPKRTKIIWIDHHPLERAHKKYLSSHLEFVHELGPCAAELVYRHFSESLPEHALRLALYGAIGDYCDSTPFAKVQFENFDKRTLYLEAGLLVQALQEIDYRSESKDLVRRLTLGIKPSSMDHIVSLAMSATKIEHEVFRYVQKNAKKSGHLGYVLDLPVHGYRGKTAKFAAYVTDSIVGISARTSEDHEIDMSIRRRNSDINLNKALGIILADINESHGGGHPAAAGASLLARDFPVFLERFTEYIDQLQH